MGSSHWSDEDYKERATSRKRAGKDAFEHDHAVRAGKAKSQVHQGMNPRGVVARESRDSEAHPNSHAVAVLFDVTGSMQSVPRVLQQNLPKLMNLLIRKGYLDHPQIMVGAIGDATCDDAPLQVGQFESGIEIEDDLGKLYLEGGGGPSITESYELAMYFMAWHTAIDCFEKRGKKGYLFIIGDEAPYPAVKRKEIQKFIGDGIQADLPLPDVLKELQRRYEVFFVIPKMTSNWGNEEIRRRWGELLGQNVLRLEDPAGVCELIASVIGLVEDKVDLTGVATDLAEVGTSTTVTRAVGDALVAVSASRGKAPKA